MESEEVRNSPNSLFCDVFVAFAVVDSKAPSWQRLRQRERKKTPGLIFSQQNNDSARLSHCYDMEFSYNFTLHSKCKHKTV